MSYERWQLRPWSPRVGHEQLVWTEAGTTMHVPADDGLTVCGRRWVRDASNDEKRYYERCRNCDGRSAPGATGEGS